MTTTGKELITAKQERDKQKTHRVRTGIYGGSFNPIHLGHTRLGEWLCREGLVDELWFLVSPQNPLKTNATDLLDDDLRLILTNLAVEESGTLKVSDFEMHLPRPSYMVSTLRNLCQAYPERHFTLVIGADNWHRFPQWKDHEEILRHYDIIIYPRDGYPIDASTLPPGVTLAIGAPLFDISSTDIRKAIAEGNCNGEWLAPAVWEEIRRRGLYGAGKP